jgi:hypothetical protein
VVRFITLWKNTPTDIEAFERHYRHTGSKFNGAGGEDNGPGNPKDTGDKDNCVAAPVTPPAPPGPPGSTAAPSAAAASSSAAVPATAVAGVPKLTG